ncbi:hypothetical protein [Pontimicrobium sp. MEBiC06410]
MLEPNTTPVLCPDCPPVEECEVNEGDFSVLKNYFGDGNVYRDCSLDNDSNVINFSSVEEAIAFFEDLKTIDADESEDVELQNGGIAIINFRQNIRNSLFNYITVDIDVKANLDNFYTEVDECSIISISSSLITDSLALSWSMQQGEYLLSSYQGSTHLSQVVVNTTIDAKFAIEGLGFGGSEKFKFQCVFNKLSGERHLVNIID